MTTFQRVIASVPVKDHEKLKNELRALHHPKLKYELNQVKRNLLKVIIDYVSVTEFLQWRPCINIKEWFAFADLQLIKQRYNETTINKRGTSGCLYRVRPCIGKD